MYFVKLMKKYVARERRRGPAADFGGEPPVFSLEPNVQRDGNVELLISARATETIIAEDPRIGCFLRCARID